VYSIIDVSSVVKRMVFRLHDGRFSSVEQTSDDAPFTTHVPLPFLSCSPHDPGEISSFWKHAIL
jgi:hypothetical protein